MNDCERCGSGQAQDGILLGGCPAVMCARCGRDWQDLFLGDPELRKLWAEFSALDSVSRNSTVLHEAEDLAKRQIEMRAQLTDHAKRFINRGKP